MLEKLEIITLDARGSVRPIVLIPENGPAIKVVIRGDPPKRFMHAGRVWVATGAMTQPPACPLSYEYRLATDLS